MAGRGIDAGDGAGGLSVSAVAAGVLAALVGFGSSFAVIIHGLTAVGASQAQAASGLMALSVSMGIAGIALSLWMRQPISVAWSTPGAALLGASGAIAGGFQAAVGAFVAAALMIVAAGLWRPLGRSIAAIPAPIANAMLAGILFQLCVAPVWAMAELPVAALTLILVWVLVGRYNRLYAVPAAVIVAFGWIAATADGPPLTLAALAPAPVFVDPAFSPAALIGVALPLFIVTMASQNIPGIAVLSANGYRPEPGPLFTATGLFGLLAAPFGGHAVNLAAITAAICAGPDAHPDPARRYWAAVVAGLVYVVLGLAAGAATAFIAASPPILIEAVAGLALLGAFGSSLAAAVHAADDREAAIVTFVVSASGLTLFGVGGAFWGLLGGLAMMAVARLRR